jgi:hypothetical protein
MKIGWKTTLGFLSVLALMIGSVTKSVGKNSRIGFADEFF